MAGDSQIPESWALQQLPAGAQDGLAAFTDGRIEAADMVAVEKHEIVALLDRHERDLYRVAYLLVGPQTALEVMEDTMVYLDETRIRDSDSNLLHYTYRILVERSRAEYTFPLLLGTVEFADSVSQPVVASDGNRIIPLDFITALWKLTPKQREAAVLRHCMGLSVAETSYIMGVSIDEAEGFTANATRDMRSLVQIS